MEPEYILECNNLCKLYSQTLALNNLTWRVPRGSMYGLVGPNGAGKSTLFSICSGLLAADYGQAKIGGYDIVTENEKAKPLLGLLPDGMHMFDRLTGFEHLCYVARLQGLDKQTARERANELLETFGLPVAKGKIVAEYSTGMRKKLGLALALIHRPRLLLLDEPFEAVDPVSAESLKRVLVKYLQGGGSVVISSHVMSLVKEICDHVAIMKQGQILAAGTVAEVAAGKDLNERFMELVGVEQYQEGDLAWLEQ